MTLQVELELDLCPAEKKTPDMFLTFYTKVLPNS